ncbi:MAG TPA: nickel pincer cofactor biosynthesis protein LarB [Bacillota bacterium]|nr:nickel pincer cofactor biosynthesis protein LarB [Bacillota bacterium]
MDPNKLRVLLQEVRSGAINVDEAVHALKELPFEDLGFARIDHHRHLRNGFPEVIYCEGKTVDQVCTIFAALVQKSGTVLATRAAESVYQRVAQLFPEARYHPLARCIVWGEPIQPAKKGRVAVVSAGTADLPVAEEAAVVAEIMGNPVDRLYDVGVAGLHRLLNSQRLLTEAAVLIVVAGMEGALASVVGGLVDRPVIAVPTSIGYGANFGGLAPLLTMLNSCASGIGVVNIDNGFGAAALANAINTLGGYTE